MEDEIKSFGELLLEQEYGLTEEDLAEYRRSLDQRLAKAARRERVMLFTTITVWVVPIIIAIAMVVFILPEITGQSERNQRLSALLPMRNPSQPSHHVGEVLKLPATFSTSYHFNKQSYRLCQIYEAFVFCSFPILLLYLLWYRRGLSLVQQESEDVVLLDLKRTVTQVRERLGVVLEEQNPSELLSTARSDLLAEKITRAIRWEKVMRIVVLLLWVAPLAICAINLFKLLPFSVLFSEPTSRPAFQPISWLGQEWITPMTGVLAISAVIMTPIYFLFFRKALYCARQEVREKIHLELRAALSELLQRLPNQPSAGFGPNF